MDNLIDRYLEFYAKGIASCVSILIKNSLKQFKLSNKFNDIVYDYLNEVSLGNDLLDNNELINITGLKCDVYTNMMLKLFIDYGVVSRMELKDDETKQSYLFIVDATMFFICVLSYVNADKCGDISFDYCLKKAINQVSFNGVSYFKTFFNASIEEIEVVFYRFIKNEQEILKVLNNDKFKVNYSKIDDKLFLSDISYHNDEILNYGVREVDFVRRNYDINIFKNGLIVLGIDLIKNNLKRNERKIFITIPDMVLKKKSYLKILIDITHIYSFKRNIVLVINYGFTLNDEEVVDYLYNEGYEIAINKDGDMPKNFDLGNAKFLLLDYNNDDEFKRVYKKCIDKYTMIITNNLNKNSRLECMNLGIEYFVKSR